MGDWWFVPALGWVGVTLAALWAVGRENLRLRGRVRELERCVATEADESHRARASEFRVLAFARRVWASRRRVQTAAAEWRARADAGSLAMCGELARGRWASRDRKVRWVADPYPAGYDAAGGEAGWVDLGGEGG